MKWALSSDRHNATLIAHISSGYDGHFILDYFVRNQEYPKLVMQGVGEEIASMLVKTSISHFYPPPIRRTGPASTGDLR